VKHVSPHDLAASPAALSAEHVRHDCDDSDPSYQPGDHCTDPPHIASPPYESNMGMYITTNRPRLSFSSFPRIIARRPGTGRDSMFFLTIDAARV
jgi:hypothetical protein